MKLRRMREELEEQRLSRFATKSVESKGRLFPEKPCPLRNCFERDANRILYSMDFRRLRHKTQVFFNAQNDHICTRMEHVLYVSSISETISRTLGLNQDLTKAIALGHDLGHAPFGHSGERTLNNCVKKIDPKLSFKHEIHSLRVVDTLATRIYGDKSSGLNLTFEVRDGIVSHCGEKISENLLRANRNKTMEDLEGLNVVGSMPATLEACVVRLVDKIAYVGRDIEDALRVNLMQIDDIPKDIRGVLGKNNSEIINTLVIDLVNSSYEQDYIRLSDEKGQALQELIEQNYRLIYSNEKIKRFEIQAQNILEGLFEELYQLVQDREKLKSFDGRVYKMLQNYVEGNNYSADTADYQIVVDFIAGMTDKFATWSFEELYWM